MIQIIRFITTACILLNISTAFYVKASSSSIQIPIVIRQKPKPQESPTPRMPYKSQIEAIYHNGSLSITFPYNAGTSTISLLCNNIEVTSTTHDTSAPIEIFIGNTRGDYTIEIMTSSGEEYIGYFTIE